MENLIVSLATLDQPAVAHIHIVKAANIRPLRRVFDRYYHHGRHRPLD